MGDLDGSGHETRNTAAGLLTGYKKHVACHEGEAEMRDNVLLFCKKMMQGTILSAMFGRVKGNIMFGVDDFITEPIGDRRVIGAIQANG
ncbi:Uncharacterised protein [Legionella spiritensis]|nr:Uncharacterised protein [Legionella spiritensis]